MRKRGQPVPADPGQERAQIPVLCISSHCWTAVWPLGLHWTQKSSLASRNKEERAMPSVSILNFLRTSAHSQHTLSRYVGAEPLLAPQGLHCYFHLSGSWAAPQSPVRACFPAAEGTEHTDGERPICPSSHPPHSLNLTAPKEGINLSP